MTRQFPTHPRVGVGAVVLRDDRVLLVRRARPPRQGEWSLPGGLQELGETVFDAAVREVFEETGVEVSIIGLVDVVDLIDRDPADGPVRWHYTLIDVAARWVRGEPVAQDDAAEARWFALDDLDRLRLWGPTVEVIRRAATLPRM